MSLNVRILHRFKGFDLDVDFTAPPGVTALFGPSGSGKSTIVAALAGLLEAQEARIEIDGRVLVDTGRGVFVPAHERRIGVVFQDARLFPHMSVEENLLYGTRYAQDPDVDRTGIVSTLGIEHLMTRRPATLSGGERQRVAIGRALMNGPALLLMDEPLASLDAARRLEILPRIEALRDWGVPVLYVSHALEEVERLATTVLRIEGGRIAGEGLGEVRARYGGAPDDLAPGEEVVVERRDGRVYLRRP